MNKKPKPSWLEVSLTVDGELAEAVAEVLSRFAPDGVVIESTNVEFPTPTDAKQDILGMSQGPLRVYAYLSIPDEADEATLEQIHQPIEEALWYLGRIRPIPQPTFRLVEENDWSETWKVNYHPIAVGEGIMIVPAWYDIQDVPLEGRTPLRMDPGMAFGTGTHPTTRLCLELIEVNLKEVQAEQSVSIIDLGCGSGILAIAALKLGAHKALGVDTDEQVLPIAEENAAMNDLAQRVEWGAGSLSDILEGKFSIQRANLVVANILAGVIQQLLKDGLTDLVEDKGKLILSGILAEQEDSIRQGLATCGMSVRYQRQEGDWIALEAERS